MYLVSVDFSKNSLITEQLGVRSFYDLPVLNTFLLNLQLINFTDIGITKAFLSNSENINNFQLFKTEKIKENDFYKTMFLLNDNDFVILFRNDTYFEWDLSDFETFYGLNEVITLEDENGFCIAVVSSVKNLKRLYNKNFGFYELINNSIKFSDVHIRLTGYSKHINSIKSYKELLFDILNNKTLFKPPYVAEGVFTKCTIPTGDFSIIPPVYLGETVQIEIGSTIGPNVIIYDNNLIAENTSIKNSVLFDNVYISSDCYLDGAVCCQNSSVKRSSAIFSGSIIGENSLIGEDMLVENNSFINKNVKFDKFMKSPFKDKANNDFENKFQGLSPDKAALLGSAIATVFNKPKILVASDGAPNSLSVKLALLSGLVAAGAECFDIGATFKAHIFFGSIFCECEYVVFVKGGSIGTNIDIYNSSNEPLSRADCCNIYDFCNKGEFVYVGKNDCKNIRQIRGLKRMYVRELTSVFGKEIKVDIIFNCNNEIITKCFQESLKQIQKDKIYGSGFYIKMNEDGEKLKIKYKNKEYSQNVLKKIVNYYTKNDNVNIKLSSGYYERLWKKDCVFLLFYVFHIMEKTGEDISALVENLPEFFISSETIHKSIKAGEIPRKLKVFDRIYFEKQSLKIPLKQGIIKVKIKSDLSGFRVLCASDNLSVSEELCDFIGSAFKEGETLDIKYK